READGRAEEGQRHPEEALARRRPVDLGGLEQALVDGLEAGDEEHHVEAEILPDDDAEDGVDGEALVGDRVDGINVEEMGDAGDETEIAIVDEAPDHAGG